MGKSLTLSVRRVSSWEMATAAIVVSARVKATPLRAMITLQETRHRATGQVMWYTLQRAEQRFRGGFFLRPQTCIHLCDVDGTTGHRDVLA